MLVVERNGLESLKGCIKDSKLKLDIDRICYAVEQLWGSKTQIIKDFTDHGLEHSNRIAEYIECILELNRNSPLTEIEKFILIVSIYLHDIGMQCDIVKYPCILTEAKELGAKDLGPFSSTRASGYSEDESDAIRKNHHLITAAWIKCAHLNKDNSMLEGEINRAIQSIDNKYINYIIDICKFHSTLNILECPPDFNSIMIGEDRKRLIAAILRLGDELDLDHRRASPEDLNLFRYLPKNKSFNILHDHTKVAINPKDGQVRITVSLTPEDANLYGQRIQVGFIDRFLKKNQILFEILNRYGYRITYSSEYGIIKDEYAHPLTSEDLCAIPRDISLETKCCSNSFDAFVHKDRPKDSSRKRFWCNMPGQSKPSISGFLYDPDSKWGHIYSPNVISFEKIYENQCIVLLGEPGIGKSQAMIEAKEATERLILSNGKRDQAFWFDLGTYQSEELLYTRLFESEKFKSWKNDSFLLHVFLDSLDECPVRTIASGLIEEIKVRKCPIERLYLRIACRASNWPMSLENDLRNLWGNEAVGIYELSPLREVDVIETTKAKGLDAEKLLSEIDRMDAIPLAVKPITLKFLLNIFSNKKSLTGPQYDLYAEGCRLLCEETNQRRRDTGFISIFSAQKLIAVAARIAAVSVFSNRYSIFTGLNNGDISEDSIAMEKLHGGFEKDCRDRFYVDMAAIRETLCTSLFSYRDGNLIIWSHQTYCEFLAAVFIAQSKMNIEQIMELFISRADSENRLIPQLCRVASWIAGMRNDVFKRILELDPEILLRSDLDNVNAEDKAVLTETLLKQYDEEKLLDFDWGIYRMHRKLNHPKLTIQLKPYICDKTKNDIVRRVAISIAEACNQHQLQDDLAIIALDPSQSLPIRTRAANSVCIIGDDRAKSKLKPLAYGDAGEDPDYELKGYGLKALWPNIITAEDLFALLTPPKTLSIGAYHIFISHEITKNLKLSDLSIALNWIKNQKRNSRPGNAFDHLIEDILLKSWENLDYPNVINDFAEVLVSRLKDRFLSAQGRDSELGNAFSSNDEKRRIVIETMLPLISDIDSLGYLVHSNPALILKQDFYWIIEHVKSFECTVIKSYWARLIKYIFDINDAKQVESILLACKENIEFREEFKENTRGIEIKSHEADKLRERYQREQEYVDKKDKENTLDPSPSERVALLLDKFESGDPNAWWRLNMELSLEPDSVHYGNEFESDLTALPGWKSANTETKERIIKAAKKYLFESDPETQIWIGQNVFHRPAFAGYRALRLLQREVPSDIAILPINVWIKWAPTILSYPLFDVGDKIDHRSLVKIAYENAPEEIIETLMLLIDRENKEYGNIFVIREIDCCWDEHLAESLLKKARETELKSACMGTLLNSLLDHKAVNAKEFAESLISSKEILIGDGQSKAVIAASALMIHANDSDWSILWSAIQRDPEFGKNVIAYVSQNRHDVERNGLKLNESQLADLYIWLACQYPHNEDIIHEGVFTPSIRDSIGDFRDSVLNQLKLAGNIEACEEIKRISEELPDLGSLKWVLYEAKTITRRKMWTPLPPEKIIEIAQRAKFG
ncbi:MAG: hypothetical protein PHQ34_03340 [Methanothrix sp.]|nr:hypothetical protein [Methanothrix sp.]